MLLLLTVWCTSSTAATCDASGNCGATASHAADRNVGGGTVEQQANVFHYIHSPIEGGDLRRLLEAGVDPDAYRGDLTGATALGWAAQHGYAPVVALLLEFGADIDAKDRDGRTALMASLNGHTAVMEALLSAGADTDVADKDMLTALMSAAFWGLTAPVKALLGAGADTDAVDQEGRTALMLAADRGHLGIMQQLLATGCDLEHKSHRGNTALHLSRAQGFTAGEQALLAAGAVDEGTFNANARVSNEIRVIDKGAGFSEAQLAALSAKINAKSPES